ncbi:hypothetical protein [Escherichia coli]|uniref:hypothetical protein n=1 Tax=Escherichia coli TaxID=562 RepID=UPI002023464A|nr:hypothetical protein [Escherichia coli]
MSKPTSYFKIHLLSGVSGGQLTLFFKLSRISCILSAPDTSHPYMAFTCYKDEEVHKCDVKTIKEKLHAQ